jgi:hypothetical protein
MGKKITYQKLTRLTLIIFLILIEWKGYNYPYEFIYRDLFSGGE